jgi:hypothetical protein
MEAAEGGQLVAQEVGGHRVANGAGGGGANGMATVMA